MRLINSPRCDWLNSALVNVFGGPRCHFARHDLADEAGFGFKCLQHISVERAFGDVLADMDFLVDIALAQNSAFALLHI
jgi:hypothetical protein